MLLHPNYIWFATEVNLPFSGATRSRPNDSVSATNGLCQHSLRVLHHKQVMVA